MSGKIRVLVVGCGNMGSSHARAYHKMEEFEIVGLVSRGAETRERLSTELGGLPMYDDFEEALGTTDPDACSINTYPETHGTYAVKAMEAGAHVFVEKPLGQTMEQAEAVAETAARTGKKVVVGYILRQHPSWMKFVEIARTLGKPLVMRMNLNQQPHGDQWPWMKSLMDSLPPIVDCGVHYVDIMCQMTRAKPIRVSAIGARLTDELKPEIYNYGQLQVTFDDGSVGWYEAGWGPMVSTVAYFVKDVIGPKGCVSIVSSEEGSDTADIDSHTKTNRLRIHHGALDANNEFLQEDDVLDMSDEPGHQDLCDGEQKYFLDAIRGDVDVSEHIADAVSSLRVVLAADASVRTGKTIEI